MKEEKKQMISREKAGKSGRGGTAVMYFLLTCKKAFRILPRFFLMILGTLAVILGVSALLYAAGGSGSILPRIRVGIITASEDDRSRYGVNVVGEMGSIKAISDFIPMTEEEAEEALAAGKIQIAAYITNDIYEDVYSGKNTPVRIRLTSEKDIIMETFLDLAEAGIDILETGESAVYAIGDTADVYPLRRSKSLLMDQISMKFITQALVRMGTWNVKTLSAYGNITVTGFYMITVLLFVTAVMFGMGFAGLYVKEEQVIDRCLYRIGVGPLVQGLIRVISMTAVLWMLFTLGTLIVCLVSDAAAFRPEYILWLLPVSFSVAGFVHMVYSLVNFGSGEIIYLLLGILMFVLGGALFPLSMLPGPLSGAASILPVQYWQKYLADMFWNGFSSGDLIRILLIGAAAMVLGTAGAYVLRRES